MLFNSNVFLQFFAAFILLFFLVRRSLTARNWLIVAGSYLFYGWWDYRFLSLLFLSSLLDFWVGLRLEGTVSESRRRIWLMVSLTGNLGMLGFFKYYGFFAESLAALLEGWGMRISPMALNIVLPVGISFYTFQTLSYTLDVYRRQLKPTRNLVSFLAYVSFFPQLVAGPIERASHLLPQMEQTRVITRAMLEEGLWLVLWGMFKKVVVADNLAPLVDLAYRPGESTGPVVLLGTVAFGLQIYGDFSGYSDIARGLALMLGFDIMVNFNLPYLATNIRDFWHRWHISLSTWLRDYLYRPLGGNRRGPGRTGINLLATMLLGGLWHGASWHFVVWGAWHGLGLLICRVWIQRRESGLRDPFPHGIAGNPQRPGFRAPGLAFENTEKEGRFPNRLKTIFSWVLTMIFVFYGWLLFRASSMSEVASLTLALGDWRCPDWLWSYAMRLAVAALPLVLMQIWQARTADLLAPLRWSVWTRSILEGVLLWAILVFWEQESTAFIYFQF